VIGVGLNVNTRRADLPEELRAGATTLLEETGREQSVDGLAARFLCHLYRLQKRFAVEKALPLDEYQGRLALTGRMVSVALGARTLTGRVKGIAGDGALVLDCGGNAVEVISGEVTHVREEEDGFAAGS
jgi:BirA family biotin operon repressor/biotin-[acetyl-CoA-carboxylase] ligase